MKEKRTGRSSVNEGGDWKRLRSQSDGRIRRGIESDPDARPTDAEFWKKGARGHADDKANRHDSPGCGPSGMPASTKGYQTRINALLRTYMDTNRTGRKQGGTHLMDVGWNCTVAL